MIAELVSALPEIYQPIYTHPELSQAASRRCDDRLEAILRAHDALRSLLGRPLKVLDLGCAQGFFSFHLAERDATVHGVDFLDKNVAVCVALAAEHPRLAVSFENNRIEDVIGHLLPDQYDLVLGLSVFHHVAHEKGAGEVCALLGRLAENSGVLLVELALRNEPLYWGESQPQEPDSLLDSVAFVHQLGRHETHLSIVPRPLYAASGRYWLLNDRAGRFDSWTENPHALAQGTHHGSRRYFFGQDSLVKQYRFDHWRGAHNQAELARERHFLTHPLAGFDTPACLAFAADATQGWIAIERWPGRLLLDVLRDGGSIDPRRIVVEVLAQLAVLERAGLYHNDVRAWNVLLAADGSARLIDYGSISETPTDCMWPRDIFLAFFIFVYEVTTGVVDDPVPVRTVALSPYRLPIPYRAWAESFWDRPLNEWNFQEMRDALVETMNTHDNRQSDVGAPVVPMESWMKAIEEAIDLQKQFGNQLNEQIESRLKMDEHSLDALKAAHAREMSLLQMHADQLAKRLHEAEESCAIQKQRAIDAERRAEDGKKLVGDASANAYRKQARIEELETSSHYWWRHAQALKAECDALRSSWSWRITAPLRWRGGRVVDGSRSPNEGSMATGRFALNAVQLPLVKTMSLILRDPILSYRINQRLLQYPAVHRHLLAVARNYGLMSPKPTPVVISNPELAHRDADTIPKLNPKVFAAAPTIPETCLLPPPHGTEPPWMRFVGHVEGHYSLAIVNRGLAGGIERLLPGRLAFVPYHGQPYLIPPELPDAQYRPLSGALGRSLPTEAEGDAVSIVHHYPLIVDALPARIRFIVFLLGRNDSASGNGGTHPSQFRCGSGCFAGGQTCADQFWLSGLDLCDTDRNRPSDYERRNGQVRCSSD